MYTCYSVHIDLMMSCFDLGYSSSRCVREVDFRCVQWKPSTVCEIVSYLDLFEITHSFPC